MLGRIKRSIKRSMKRDANWKYQTKPPKLGFDDPKMIMVKSDLVKDVQKWCVHLQKMISGWSSVVRSGLIISCWPAIVLTLAEDWISPKFSTSLICPRATFTPPYNCQPTSSSAAPTSLNFSLSLCQHLILTRDIRGQEGMIRFLEGSIGRSNPWQSCPL